MDLQADLRKRTMEIPLASAALVMLALSVPAFWPGYLSKPAAGDRYTHLHAALGTLWLLVLIAQPLLIRARRFAMHRRVGRFALVIGVAFVVAATLLSHHRMVQMDDSQFLRDGYSFYLPLVMIAIFSASLMLGFRWRSSVKIHSRFMACTLLPLLDPVLARLTYFYFPPLPALFMYQIPAFLLVGAALFLFSASLPDIPGRRDFRMFSAGTAVALLLYFFTPYSSSWLELLSWFRSLPIT